MLQIPVGNASGGKRSAVSVCIWHLKIETRVSFLSALLSCSYKFSGWYPGADKGLSMTKRAGKYDKESSSFAAACVTSVLWLLVPRRFLSFDVSMYHTSWVLFIFLCSWWFSITSNRAWTCWSSSWGQILDKDSLRTTLLDPCWSQSVLLIFIWRSEKNPHQLSLTCLELSFLGQLQLNITFWHSSPSTWKEYLSV